MFPSHVPSSPSGCKISAMETLMGTLGVSGAGSALCPGGTGGWHRQWAGTDTGLASAPSARAAKSQGSVVPEDKGGQQALSDAHAAALQQQPEPRVTCSSRLCLLCPLPALSLLSWANRRVPARLLLCSRSRTVWWKQKGTFSSSHWVFVPHVPWLSQQERCHGVRGSGSSRRWGGYSSVP